MEEIVMLTTITILEESPAQVDPIDHRNVGIAAVGRLVTESIVIHLLVVERGVLVAVDMRVIENEVAI